MNLKQAIALRVNQRLVSLDANGAPRAPGAGLAHRVVEVDRSEVTIVCRGDSFDVYAKSGQVVAFSLTPRLMVELAFFVVWSYWIKATIFGLRTRLWDWSISVLTKAENDRVWKKWKREPIQAKLR